MEKAKHNIYDLITTMRRKLLGLQPRILLLLPDWDLVPVKRNTRSKRRISLSLQITSLLFSLKSLGDLLYIDCTEVQVDAMRV